MIYNMIQPKKQIFKWFSTSIGVAAFLDNCLYPDRFWYSEIIFQHFPRTNVQSFLGSVEEDFLKCFYHMVVILDDGATIWTNFCSPDSEIW